MPKATAIFICDVRVQPEKIASATSGWTLGTFPISNGQRRDGSALYSDGAWRANSFPATMSAFLYNSPDNAQQLTKNPVRFHYAQSIDAMPYVSQKKRRVDQDFIPRFSEVSQFTIKRLELLVADRVADGFSPAQIALICEITAGSENQLKDVIRTFAGAIGRQEHRGVRGRYLHEIIENEAPQLCVGFPTAKTLREDTEANTYTTVLLQKTPEEIEKLRENLHADFDSYEPFLPLLVEYTTNLSPERILEDMERFEQEQEDRLITFNRARYGYIARYYAAFITIEDPANWRLKKFIVSYEAEYLDALLLGRLQDQLVRRSDLRLVQAMADAAHSNNLGKTSEQVMELYREIEVDSVRYWMDDASANTGKTMEVLDEFKQAIGFYKRYEVMEKHAEAIMKIATRDQQEAALESQDRIAMILAVIGALVIPLPLLNDGFDFIDKVAQKQIFVSWRIFILWFLLSGLLLGGIVFIANWLLSQRKTERSGIFSLLRPGAKRR